MDNINVAEHWRTREQLSGGLVSLSKIKRYARKKARGYILRRITGYRRRKRAPPIHVSRTVTVELFPRRNADLEGGIRQFLVVSQCYPSRLWHMCRNRTLSDLGGMVAAVAGTSLIMLYAWCSH
ncbi:hypothetical protein [Sinorhizobium terangae]|uniref:hypothetical protein n=1 Tax=Sinorhizobium terangae TaxID=110322 RepID=UPI0024B06D4E|nr:hypothetical protein [Sinorhizobium terangae]WFU51649.1 hypothetical protein QA637_29600 [Sinorhizobium terangae]